ncbi:MAG TPA: NAD-dependent epimerase/dehydratase family protein [Gemmatimonadaceae bacterium]
MRIAVIGATGHIGTWLVPRLVRAGHEVIAVSRGNRDPYQRFPEADRAHHVHIDRIQAERVGDFGKQIADLDADVVIDLICFDVGSAQHLVTALCDRVAHFIHCGTLWVHGNPPVRPYDESIPRDPFGEYGTKKVEIERFLLGEAANGFPATILHPGHITGPGWDPINPAGNLDRTFFDRLSRGETVTLPDDGRATLQHVHADDVAQAFQLAVENREAGIAKAFHVASREPVTMGDYAIEAAKWFDREAHIEYMPFDQWKTTVSERDAEITLDHILHSPGASIGKAEARLNFRPRFSATEAVRDALGLTSP